MSRELTRIWWVKVLRNGKQETHGMMLGMKTTLCGLPLPPEAGQGAERNGCEACKTAGEAAPILTPDMEAQWWAANG